MRVEKKHTHHTQQNRQRKGMVLTLTDLSGFCHSRAMGSKHFDPLSPVHSPELLGLGKLDNETPPPIRHCCQDHPLASPLAPSVERWTQEFFSGLHGGIRRGRLRSEGILQASCEPVHLRGNEWGLVSMTCRLAANS